MTSDKRWENLPSMESLKITEKFLQSEAGQKYERERLKDEQAKQRFSEFQDAFQTNAQKQHTNEVVRQEKALQLQEEDVKESKKQTALSEKALCRSNWGIVIALLALILSALSFFSR